MRKLHFKHVIALAIFAMSFQSPAGSVGGTGGSTEVTQLLNNLELVQNTINTTKTVMQEIRQVEILVQQAKSISIDDLKNIGRDAAIDAVGLTGFKNSVTTLMGDLQNSKQAAENIFRDMSLKGLTPTQYVDQIARNHGKARQNIQSLLQDVNQSISSVGDTYKQVQAYQDRIPATEGVQQSMQLLNSQINTMLVQNAKMQQSVAANLNSTAAVEAQKNVNKEASDDAYARFVDQRRRDADTFKNSLSH